MALETGTRIEDLVTTNPETGDQVGQGDDHLRLIKTCVTGSFPSLGSTAVSATAEELNDVANKLVSFNGRTATAVVPTEGDYSADMLSDVSTTDVVTGDSFRYNGSTFTPRYKGISQAQMTAQSYNSGTEFKPEIDGSQYATTGLTIDTTNNRITNATGKSITVIARACFYADALALDHWFSIRRDGTIYGEEYFVDRTGDNGDFPITFERVLDLTDGQYVEVWLRRLSADAMDVTTGGTFLVMGV